MSFGIIEMWMNNILILENQLFLDLKNENLQKAGLKTKPKEYFINSIEFIFNNYIIQKKSNSI